MRRFTTEFDPMRSALSYRTRSHPSGNKTCDREFAKLQSGATMSNARGVKPPDLPVLKPTRFQLVLNVMVAPVFPAYPI